MNDFASVDGRDRGPQLRRKQNQVRQLEALRKHHHDTEATASEHLLIFQVPVCCHEHLEARCLRAPQEFAILHTRPPGTYNRRHVMRGDFCGKTAVEVLVQQNTPTGHRGHLAHAACGSWPM